MVRSLPTVFQFILKCSVEYLVEFLSDWLIWKFHHILREVYFPMKPSEIVFDIYFSHSGNYKIGGISKVILEKNEKREVDFFHFDVITYFFPITKRWGKKFVVFPIWTSHHEENRLVRGDSDPQWNTPAVTSLDCILSSSFFLHVGYHIGCPTHVATPS